MNEKWFTIITRDNSKYVIKASSTMNAVNKSKLNKGRKNVGNIIKVEEGFALGAKKL